MPMFENRMVVSKPRENTRVAIRVFKNDLGALHRVFKCHGNSLIGDRLALFCKLIVENDKLQDLEDLYRECAD